MSKDDYTGIGILLLIIGIALFGGTKNNLTGPPVDNTPKTEAEQRVDIQKQLNEAEKQALDIQKQIDEKEAQKTESKYKGLVFIRYVSRSTKPGNEYITIQTDNKATTSIPITGWTIRSASSGNSITIPRASYLFFAGQVNSEENIILSGGETVYIVTGISPNGASFKVNKCSGYLSQFQTFIPYLTTSCPRPREMDLSSIPKLTINDACLDYIEYFPSCKIETKTLPLNWSYECKNFIYEKINYNSCINTYKNDPDFYKKEWRVYLKRSDILWKQRKENIILYDNEGKIVHSLTY
ncbi:MAG: hypothetical protein WC095_01040 [Candidatus Paceibacterota bacterium]